MQRLASVAQLPARFLVRAALRAARLARQPVARRRLPAIVAVLGQAPAQLPHLGRQGGDLAPQQGVLGFEDGDLFVWRHASMLHPLDKST